MLFLRILLISAPVMRTVAENEEYNFRCDDVAAKQPITQRIPRITKMNLTTKRGLQNHI